MNQPVKGRVVLNGVHIEVEANNPSELVSIISSIVGRKATAQPAAPKEEITAQVTKKRDFVAKPKLRGPRGKYHIWREQDVVGIARIVAQHGPNIAGVRNKGLAYMKNYGIEQGRREENIKIFTGSLHAYLYAGKTDAVSDKVRKILTKNGFIPFSQRRSFADTSSIKTPVEA